MGVLHGIRTFLPHIRAHGEGGHIVNTASMAGMNSGLGFSPYCGEQVRGGQHVGGAGDAGRAAWHWRDGALSRVCANPYLARVGAIGRSDTVRRRRRTPQARRASSSPSSPNSDGQGSIRRMSLRKFSPRSARTNSTCSRIPAELARRIGRAVCRHPGSDGQSGCALTGAPTPSRCAAPRASVRQPPAPVQRHEHWPRTPGSDPRPSPPARAPRRTKHRPCRAGSADRLGDIVRRQPPREHPWRRRAPAAQQQTSRTAPHCRPAELRSAAASPPATARRHHRPHGRSATVSTPTPRHTGRPKCARSAADIHPRHRPAEYPAARVQRRRDRRHRSGRRTGPRAAGRPDAAPTAPPPAPASQSAARAGKTRIPHSRRRPPPRHRTQPRR